MGHRETLELDAKGRAAPPGIHTSVKVCVSFRCHESFVDARETGEALNHLDP